MFNYVHCVYLLLMLAGEACHGDCGRADGLGAAVRRGAGVVTTCVHLFSPAVYHG